ncbi:hypothetical protein KIN20_033492 [Parelaphostrongylus tenuis]|uniref:Uncharacterized protein n=1 Tax=Parelaphostrongylus tenuis TaxID=148309 RepID=A0AAD5WIU5_PARTN|nr:hypothetical protein KIN20_033492 [Parelaphostrongylus tenuis]
MDCKRSLRIASLGMNVGALKLVTDDGAPRLAKKRLENIRIAVMVTSETKSKWICRVAIQVIIAP